MKQKIGTSIIIALLILQTTIGLVQGQSGTSPRPAIVDGIQTWFPAGRIVQAFALSDGSVAFLTLRESSYGGNRISLETYRASDGGDKWDSTLNGEGNPERVVITACGKIIHAFANWPDGELQYFRWELEQPLAACRDYEVFIPLAVN